MAQRMWRNMKRLWRGAHGALASGLVLAWLVAMPGAALAAPAGEPTADDLAGPMSVVIGIDSERLTCFAGGTVGGEPTTAEDMAARLRDGETYRVFDLTGEKDEVVAIGVPRNEGGEGECSDLWRQDLALDPRARAGFSVAVRLPPATTAPLPKTLEVIEAPLPEHVELLRAFLARRDVPDPKPNIRQAIRTDLDGDGAPDYILNVVRVDPRTARRGDHSIVLVVKGDGAASRTFIVQEEVSLEDSDYPSTLWVSSVVAILDIDADGIAEIITEGGYLYGGGWEVIRWDGSTFEHILFCGCDG